MKHKLNRSRVIIASISYLVTIIPAFVLWHVLMKPPLIVELITVGCAIIVPPLAIVGYVLRGTRPTSFKQRILEFVVGPIVFGTLCLLGGMFHMFIIGIALGGLVLVAVNVYFLTGPRE